MKKISKCLTTMGYLKCAATHPQILSLTILLFGILEFTNNVLFKLFYKDLLPHQLMVHFFPILFMYFLKSLELVAVFFIFFIGLSVLNQLFVFLMRQKTSAFPQTQIDRRLILFFDLLAPAMLLYILLAAYDSTPVTLAYYIYHLSAASSQFKSVLEYRTLILIINGILALLIVYTLVRFRISGNWRTQRLALLFILSIAVSPGLVFLIRYFDKTVLVILLFIALALLFFFMLYWVKKLVAQRRFRLYGVFLGTLVLAAAVGNILIFKKIENNRMNVVCIVLDTLRKKSFNAEVMPFLYALKDRGAYFPHSYSSSDNTVTAHNAIYYGKYASNVGLEKGPFPCTTLPEDLQAQNYHTIAISANGRFCIVNGYSKGIDDFYEVWKKENHVRTLEMMTDYHLSSKFPFIHKYWLHYQQKTLNKAQPVDKTGMRSEDYRFYNYEPAQVVNEFVKTAIQRKPPTQPFFLFVNYLDPHTPYLAPDPGNINNILTELKRLLPDIYEKLNFETIPVTSPRIYEQIMLMWQEIKTVQDKDTRDQFLTTCYEENLRYLDGQMKKLFDYFEQINLLQNTLIIVTSDHGESIGEHDMYEHGNKRLYNPEIEVPLFMLFPHHLSEMTKNRVININTQSVDLYPTIIQFLGLKSETNLNGESLFPFIFSEPDSTNPRYCISEYTGVSAITDHHYKLILTDQSVEFYDLLHDPEETSSLAAEMSIQVREFKQKLDELRKTAFQVKSIAPREAETETQYDPETLEQLKTLGYIK